MPSKSESPKNLPRWELWRQNDNGVRVLVAQYVDLDSALNAMKTFESHHHKQTYWVVENRSSGVSDQPK